MEVKRAVKRIAALGAGAVMIGATVMGAMAANLSDYPKPFVTDDGKFDAFLVVGQKAAAEDVVGAIDIGTSMQFALKQETAVSTDGGATVSVSQGVKVRGTGTEVLNYGEYFGDVLTTPLDNSDLPVMLADGKYTESKGNNRNDETYTQEIDFTVANNAQAIHDQPDDGLDADTYLEISNNKALYTYTLEFDDPLDYDSTSDTTAKDDFVPSTLEIQGNMYTFNDVKLSSGAIDQIELLAGETLVWLTQDQVVEKTIGGTTHQIKVVDVTEGADSCGIMVDGDLSWLDVGETDTVNGVQLSVVDAKAIHAQLQDVDVCEVNVGSTELKLRDGRNLERDGVEVRDAKVYLNVSQSTAGTWDGFKIQLKPDDDVWLKKGESFTDPALENFKIVMEGVTKSIEDMEWSSSGSKDADFTFTNNEGKEVKVPMHYEESYPSNAMATAASLSGAILAWGEDSDQPMLVDDGNTTAPGSSDYFVCGTTSADIEDCDGVEIWFVTDGGSAHVLEITNLDSSRDEISIRDNTEGRNFDDKSYTNGTVSSISLGSLGNLDLFINESNGRIEVSKAVYDAAETSNGAELQLHKQFNVGDKQDGSSKTLTAVEVSEDDVDDTQIANAGKTLSDLYGFNATTFGEGQNVELRPYYDTSTDDQLEIDWLKPTSTSVAAWVRDSYDKVDSDSDVKMSSSAHGTIVEWDDTDNKWLKIHYPKSEAEVNAFITPVSAQVTSSGSGSVTSVTLTQINVGSAKLDTELSSYTDQNLIIVGGPCANQAAAAWLGNPEDCLAGFQEGEAVVKLLNNADTGKYALLVAGYSAADTRLATTVVADYNNADWAFSGQSGNELKVSGTDVSNIKVEAPQ